MKKSTIITVLAFVLGVVVLGVGFVLLTENNISGSLFPSGTTNTTTTTTKPTTTTTTGPKQMDMLKADLSEYITLGEYKGIAVNVDEEQSVYDAVVKKLEENVSAMLIGDNQFTKIEQGVIEEGMIFCFDFKGLLNGEAFDNGSATNQYAYIDGNNFYILAGSTFIDGFAQGIIGKDIGSEFNIDIKFPDDYGNEKLNGKDTVFEIKIHYAVEVKELTAEYLAGKFGGKFVSVDEYRDSLLQSVMVEVYFNDIWQVIVDSFEVTKYPEEEYEYVYHAIRSQIEQFAEKAGMTYENYLGSETATKDNVPYKNDEEVCTYVKRVVKEELVLYSIIHAEDIKNTEEEYKAFCKEIAAQYGIPEAYLTYFIDENTLREELLMNTVIDFIKNNNRININVVPDKTTTK